MKDFASSADYWRAGARYVYLAAYGLLGWALVALVWSIWGWMHVPLSGAPLPPLILPQATTSPATTHPSLVASATAPAWREALAAPAPVAKPPPAPIPMPDFEIVATLLGPDQEPQAYVRAKDSHKLLLVQQGGTVGVYTIMQISEGEITVESKGIRHVLRVGKKAS